MCFLCEQKLYSYLEWEVVHYTMRKENVLLDNDTIGCLEVGVSDDDVIEYEEVSIDEYHSDSDSENFSGGEHPDSNESNDENENRTIEPIRRIECDIEESNQAKKKIIRQ